MHIKLDICVSTNTYVTTTITRSNSFSYLICIYMRAYKVYIAPAYNLGNSNRETNQFGNGRVCDKLGQGYHLIRVHMDMGRNGNMDGYKHRHQQHY